MKSEHFQSPRWSTRKKAGRTWLINYACVGGTRKRPANPQLQPLCRAFWRPFILPFHHRADVVNGSIATRIRYPRDFRSTPELGHCTMRMACLKRARSRHRQATRSSPLLPTTYWRASDGLFFLFVFHKIVGSQRERDAMNASGVVAVGNERYHV